MLDSFKLSLQIFLSRNYYYGLQFFSYQLKMVDKKMLAVDCGAFLSLFGSFKKSH